jgi:hypothetical protein
MSNELNWAWNEIVLSCTEIIFQDLPVSTEENHQKSRLG